MKIINVVVGLGTAIILSGLILLGIKAFYPEPAQPDYYRVKPLIYREFNCDKTDLKCIKDREAYYQEQQKEQEENQRVQKEYDNKIKVYNRDVFVIANVIGMLVFIGGFLLLFRAAVASQSIPVGIMISGLYGIIYGYSRGWYSISDKMKFFVGLIVAVLVIGGSMWLLQKYYKERGQNS